MGNQKKRAGRSSKNAFSSYGLVPQAAKDRGSDHLGEGAEDMLKKTHRVLSRAFTASSPPGPASLEELQQWAIQDATTWGDSKADTRSGALRVPPSACNTKPPVGPAPRNTEGATGEIWSLTAPLGKGTGGPARTISPHGVPIPQRRHTTSGRNTIAGVCLRRIHCRSQASF